MKSIPNSHYQLHMGTRFDSSAGESGYCGESRHHGMRCSIQPGGKCQAHRNQKRGADRACKDSFHHVTRVKIFREKSKPQSFTNSEKNLPPHGPLRPWGLIIYHSPKRSTWIACPGSGALGGLGFLTGDAFFLGGSKVCFHCFWTSLITTLARLK